MRKAALLAIVVVGALVAVLLWASSEPGDEAAASLRHATVEAPSLPSFVTEGVAAAERPAEPAQLDAPANSPTNSPAEVERLVLRVLHPDGVPAQGCAVVVVAASGEREIAWSDVTGDDGRVTGAPLARPAEVWVDGGTYAATSFALDEARGAHDLVLPAGDIVEGRVELVGGPPESVLLGLKPRGKSDVVESVYQRLRRAAAGPGEWMDYTSSSLRTGADGSFRFSGLPANWQGSFAVSDAYELEAGTTLEVRAPEHGRVLRLRHVPRLLFRVVTAGARAPAAFAQASVTTSTGGGSTGRSLICDGDGRGGVTLERMEPTVWAELQVASADAKGRVVQRFELAGRSANEFGDIDLGDVELGERWSIPFRAVEPDGAPIAGAVAGVVCGESVVSGATAADGTGRIDGVPLNCPELFVGAAGHETGSVALPAEQSTEPLTVRLMPCATLGLHLVSSDGQPRPDLYLAISLTERLSSGDPKGQFHERALQLGQRLPHSSYGSTYRDHKQDDGSVLRSRSNVWHMQELEDIELGCVEPGSPVALKVVDSANYAVWSDIVTLAEGERRVLEAIIAARPVAFELLVTDEQGAPLQGVEVSPKGSGEEAQDWSDPSMVWETDAAGRADLGGLYAPSLDVSCEKDGYAKAALRGLVPGVPGHLTMARGLGLDMHCVGPTGRPAAVSSVLVFAGKTLDAQPVDPVRYANGTPERAATWHVDGLEPGPVKITVYVAGQEFEFEHEASERSVTLSLPDWGELHVRGLPAARDTVVAQVVMRPADAEHATHSFLTKSDLERDELVVPILFPGRYEVSVIDILRGNALAGPDAVEVRAGETATVTLHAPSR